MNARIQTPWGLSDDSGTAVAEGIKFYSTPSHGGYHVSNARLAELTAVHGPVKTFCGHLNWFEEDCDWAYVATAFPQFFTSKVVQIAKDSIAYWQKQKASAKRDSDSPTAQTSTRA